MGSAYTNNFLKLYDSGLGSPALGISGSGTSKLAFIYSDIIAIKNQVSSLTTLQASDVSASMDAIMNITHEEYDAAWDAFHSKSSNIHQYCFLPWKIPLDTSTSILFLCLSYM